MTVKKTQPFPSPAMQGWLASVSQNPSAIAIGFQVSRRGNDAYISSEFGASPVDQDPVSAAIKNFASRVKRGSLTTADASRGPVNLDRLAPDARIKVPAGGKLQLQGTGHHEMPAYVSANSASPAHDRSLGHQAFAGNGLISYELPLTGKPGSFEIEVMVPFASHGEIWNATKLTHMEADLSGDSTYARRHFFVDVVEGQSDKK